MGCKLALPSPETCWGQCLCKYPRANKAVVTETSRNMGHAPRVASGLSEGPPKTPTLDTQCVLRPDPASQGQARCHRCALGIYGKDVWRDRLLSDKKGHRGGLHGRKCTEEANPDSDAISTKGVRGQGGCSCPLVQGCACAFLLGSL